MSRGGALGRRIARQLPGGAALSAATARSVALHRALAPPAGVPRPRPTKGRPVLAHAGLTGPEIAALQSELALSTRLRAWRPGGREGGPDVLLHLDDGRPVDGPGLASLRVLALAGTPVVSDQPVVRVLLGQDGPVPDRTSLLAEARALAAQPLLRDRRGHQAWRAVVEGRLGARAHAPVSAVVPTMRPHQLEHVVATVGAQRHPSVQLVLVTHGFEPDPDRLRGWQEEHGVEQLVVVPAARELTLGRCLTLGVQAADGAYLAKMDDDNHYGPHYLADLVRAAAVTGAQTVGKGAHYVHLSASGATMLRFADREHGWGRFVQGGTLLVPREVLQQVPFADVPRAVDTTFLDALHRDGGRVWSADRFGFVSVRAAETGDHTWPVGDYDLLSRSARLELFGDPAAHVAV